MIAFIEGEVVASGDGFVILKASSGVGYEIFCKQSLAFSVQLGQSVLLHTYLGIKEDSRTLYGFENIEELYWFKSLIKVSGVGLKTALAILNGISIDDIINSIQSANDAAFANVSGIGKKTALRIVSELEKEPFKNNLAMSSLRCNESFALIDIKQIAVEAKQVKQAKPSKTKKITDATDIKNSKTASNASLRGLINDASLALEALGYSRLESFTKASLIAQNNPQITIDELIKACLRKE